MSACPHGEPHPSACLECVDGQPAPIEKWSASSSVVAEWPGFCARDDRHHWTAGDTIFGVPGEGWCCGRCAQLTAPTWPEQVDAFIADNLDLRVDQWQREAMARWRGQGQVIDRVQVIRANGIVQCWCQVCGESFERQESERVWTTETIRELVAGHMLRCEERKART